MLIKGKSERTFLDEQNKKKIISLATILYHLKILLNHLSENMSKI